MMSREERQERESQGYYVCWRCGWEKSVYSSGYAVAIEIHSQAHYDEEVSA